MQLDITLGTPMGAGALTLVPLFRTAPASSAAYRAGPDAWAAGTLEVRELADGAVVHELQVHNHGEAAVLLVEGETVLGGKQNRSLNLSVLVPAAATTAVPVSCLEAGRWGAPSASGPSSRMANPAVRRAKTRSTVHNVRRGLGKRSDQDEVWAMVDETLDAVGSASQTRALEDAFDEVASRPWGGDLAAATALPQPLPAQVGVVGVIGGRPVVLDLFDRPETLAAYWEQLVRGYELDAFEVAERPLDDDALAAFLRGIASAEEVSVDATGLGHEVHLTSGTVAGAALALDGEVVHLTAHALA